MITPTDAAALSRLNDLYRARIQAERRGDDTTELSALILEARRQLREGARRCATR